MKHSSELEELLFKRTKPEQSKQGEELKQLIENIPYPHVDITITSYSEFSDNTPQKYLQKPVHTENIEPQSYKLKRIPTQGDPYATDGSDVKMPVPKQKKLQESYEKKREEFQASGSGGSYLESMTPQRMNRIVDWSKNHVTPGDSKNIFPQVIAPSIEFSNENSLSLNAFSKPKIQQNIEGKVWEKQKRHMEQELFQCKKQVRKMESENNGLSSRLSEAEEKCKLLQDKYKDYSCLENLRGKNLEIAKQQIKQLKSQMEQKDEKIVDMQDHIRQIEDNEKRLQEAIESELRELHNQIELKDQMVRAMKNQQQNEDHQRQTALSEYEKTMSEGNMYIQKMKQHIDQQQKALQEKDNIIENQEMQINNLQNRLQKEMDYRKQDEKQLNEYRSKETLLYQYLNPQCQDNIGSQQQQGFEDLQREYLNQKKIINQLTEQLQNQQYLQQQQQQQQQIQPTQSRIIEGCRECALSREELQNIILECQLNEDQLNLDPDQKMFSLIRNTITFLLTTQREQIDTTFQHYEEQIKDLTDQLKYFKDSNEEVISENNRIQEQIQNIIQQKEIQEQQIFNEYEKLRVQNQNLQKDLKEQRSIKKDDQEIEQLRQYVAQLKQELQLNQQELSQQKQEIQLFKQQSKQIIVTHNQYKSVQEEKNVINQELVDLRTQYQNQIQELYVKIHEQEQLLFKQDNDLKQKDQKIETLQLENQTKQAKDGNLCKAISELQEEKQKLSQKISQLEQVVNSNKQDEKIEKIIQIGKEKDKKNIELYNSNKQLQIKVKELEENSNQNSEDCEKFKKQINLKNQEIKQILEQNKQLSEINQQMNNRLVGLQQQIHQFEQEIKQNYLEQSPQIPEKLKSHPSHKSLDPIKTPSNLKVIELVEGFNQYQQEFYHLKKMFTDRLKHQEVLQETIQSLQQQNYQLSIQVQKQQNENQTLKDKIEDYMSQKKDETAVRCSAATGDSLNIRSFLNQHDYEDQRKNVTNVFQQNQLIKGDVQFQLVDLIQPEIMSMEDTIQILKEILRRSVKSVEMIKMICHITEIRELLIIIIQVEEKLLQHQNLSQNKRAKIISSILMNSNVKILGSDQSRKKSGQRQKPSHRSEVMDFFDS